MERVNDIMMRTVQQRQEAQEQRSSQEGTPPQGSRPKQSLTHRPPLPEQTARLGQQNSYAAPSAQPAHKPLQSSNLSGRGNRGEPGSRYPQQRPYDQALRRSDAQRHSVYHQPFQPLAQEPEYSAGGQEEPKIAGDYYETYAAMPPADVQENWEDDAESMHYGDWETEAGYGSYAYSSTNREAPFVAPLSSQDATRPPARVSPRPQTRTTRNLANLAGRDPEPRSPLTRKFREEQMAPAPTPPAPLAPAQEAQRYQRNTQPLNPRAMAGMSQHIVQGASRVVYPTQQTARQVDMRNSITHATPMPSHSLCPLCKGAGYLRADVPYGHPNFGKPIACECKEIERTEKRRLQLRTMSNLDAFSDKSFRNFNPRVPGVQEAFKLAQVYADNPDGWLLLIGKNGCGKTHLAAAIANQHLAQGSLVLFATVPDLLDHLRATFAPTSTVVYDQLFSTMREAELLVLDDLGSEQNSSWASEKLFQLLNYRYNSRFPTVITTNNLRLQAVDERIRSRLMDRSLVIEVTMDRAQDYRPHNPRRE